MAVGDMVEGPFALPTDGLDYEPTLDIGKIFVERCNSEQNKSEAIVAIEILIMLMKSSSIRTVQGLDDMVNDAVRQMRQTDRTNCSVKSACDIFQRFITLAVLDNSGDFGEVKKVLLDRAYLFLDKINGYRDIIARNTSFLIRNNFHILTHAKSRAVIEALSYIVNNETNRRTLHCYVTQCMPSASGCRMVQELRKRGVSSSSVPDTAVAYLMPQIDAVLLGAEAVVESGGVLNALGSCSISMIAHSMGKPVYVLVESFKFLRVYPLDQRSIPDELKWPPSQLAKVLESKKPQKPKLVLNDPRYDPWLEVARYRDKRVEKYMPLIDYTNPIYITSLVTDLGIFTPSAVSDELIKLSRLWSFTDVYCSVLPVVPFAAYDGGMGVLFLLFFVLVAHASSSAYNTQTPQDSRLLILFLDGLRWDYFNHFDETGGVGRMRAQGCHIPRVKPAFPANCHTNMHALFAGHNSTNLDVFNDGIKAEYTHPELLWNRATKQGKSVKLFHFPFCSSLLERGMDCVQPVGEQISLNTTLGDALQSLANRTNDLAVVYFGELDRVAHAHGPSSEELKHGETIRKVDEAIFNVIQSLQILQDASLNFAVVSDHGMTDFRGFLTLDRVFKWKVIGKVVNLGSAVGLWPKPGAEKDLSESLSAKSHFQVYTPQTMPVTSWHPSRLPPIVLIAEPGYVFQVSYHSSATWDHLLSARDIPPHPRGVHGYLPDVTDMHTTFLAYGPAFEFGCGEEQGRLYTYDLFPLLNTALFGGAVVEFTRGGEPKIVWEMKLLGGILFILFAVVLILGIALRRLLKIGRKRVDSSLICDFEEVDEDEEGLKTDAEMKA